MPRILVVNLKDKLVTSTSNAHIRGIFLYFMESLPWDLGFSNSFGLIKLNGELVLVYI
jgi:hypothetical protein